MTKKTTIVREHPRHVPVSRKNPKGITIVVRHPRRIQGASLDRDALKSIPKTYPTDGIPRPTPGRLKEFNSADTYDDLIAIWTDYFNKTLHADPPLEPDMIKALIASAIRLPKGSATQSSCDWDHADYKRDAFCPTECKRRSEGLDLQENPAKGSQGALDRYTLGHSLARSKTEHRGQ